MPQEPTQPRVPDRETIGGLVEREAKAFYGERPAGALLILDDLESLQGGKFRGELRLLGDLLRERGWRAAIGSAAEALWEGERLTYQGLPVAFVVNRSTDFFWASDDFAALRKAYASGAVYVAPNPFTYATRSDKGLMEWLSSPDRDSDLGIEADERRILSAHVPETPRQHLRVVGAQDLPSHSRAAQFERFQVRTKTSKPSSASSSPRFPAAAPGVEA